MRKLKLNVADLEVTSFDTDRAGGLRGTVAGHVTLPATNGTNCIETNACSGGTGCDDTFDCTNYNCTSGNTANGNPSCDQYSCVDGSGCGLCYTQSCEVTYCSCVNNPC